MKYLWIPFSVLALAVFLVLAAAFVCFVLAFYVKREKPKEGEHEFSIPKGNVYEPFRDQMISWMKETYAYPCRDFYIKSRDGLTLHASYYEQTPGAPIELMFHGYRGTAERDLCGGMQRCFSLGRNAFIVDQRGSGKSEGRVISFGANEQYDCLSWVNFLAEHFGKDVKVILCGISMGASTVMLASSHNLPDNVVGVLADCGYSSAKEIIFRVIRQIGLPPKVFYPLVRLGGIVFGHFDVDKISPLDAVSKSRVPVIFFHGESDDFVPCEMSKACFDACSAPKKLVTVPNAGHGLSYLVDPELYLSSLAEFYPEYTVVK
ncbi:MAG: alpha/beta hydrolase [Clostridia bacterium]|nr:alpha/beta hydrolase [Clostridia bacterium]